MLLVTVTTLLALLIFVVVRAEAKPRARISPAREHVVHRLNRGLVGTPMAGTGRALEAAAHKWQVSPFFIIGVSGKESSLGHRSCWSNRRNIWGLKSCRLGKYVDLNGDGVREHLGVFRSWAAAYDFFARYIRARQSHADTPWEIHGYCECDERQWADTVVFWMRRLFDVGPSTRYAR